MIDHSTLPSIRDAKLPEKYEAAKIAIRECSRLDECKEWTDRSAALASYARQSEDKELEKTAMRIRARACRRCGELLKEIEKAQGGDRKSKGRQVPFDRKQAAKKAGLSPDKAKQSIRVANVHEEDFEEQLESDDPPTLTDLAKQGRKKSAQKPIYERLGITKKAFQAGMYFRGALRDMAQECKKYDPKNIAEGSTARDRPLMKKQVSIILTHLNKLKKLL